MDASSNGHLVGRCCFGYYALVQYIPEPLGAFLNELRAELVPGCKLRAHVTLLPPRQLKACDDQLIDDLAPKVNALSPFEVTAGEVQLFPGTNVIYLELADGRKAMEQYHEELSGGLMAYDEPFPFHPHITLAQELRPELVAEKLEFARRRWAEYRGSRSFTVNHMVFVRNISPTRWDTLSEHELMKPTLLRTA
ncbi:2'-5' RNA ligase family protein [uncultured Paludibaculum sp.]|uniref:2'-5' RNA ligase family protein n=1 Tax=uncultured Paludibaculum sp. TaxID=1765020 RepID=UPI002AAB6584|nr:2'-5' RNA ligase family protein [uncultured Paludibaculum sp.]